MPTLLKTALQNLKEQGYTEKDVSWIGTRNGEITATFEEFKKIAKKLKHDPSYGMLNLNDIPVIVLKDDSWFEIQEYNGEQWFEYKKTPVKQPNSKTLADIFI